MAVTKIFSTELSTEIVSNLIFKFLLLGLIIIK